VTAPPRRLLTLVVPLMLLVSISMSAARGGGFLAEADDGEAVYFRECAGCHGNEGQGDSAGPSLKALLDSEEAVVGVSQLVREGYGNMDAFGNDLPEAQIEAVADYVVSQFGISGDVSDGEVLYGLNCADCHGAAGQGGAASSLIGVPSPMVVSAIRSGPFSMPAYGQSTLSDSQVAAIAAYVEETLAPSPQPVQVDMLELSLRTVHVLAVVIYLGGGILLHGPLRRALRLIPPGQAAIVGTHVGQGFTYLSWLSLALWGSTGYWMLFRLGWGDPSSPFTLFISPERLGNPHGVSMLVMLSVWYLIVVNASIITFLLRPRLARRVTADADTEAANRVVETISDSARWVDILALTNLLLTVVGLASGALFL